MAAEYLQEAKCFEGLWVLKVFRFLSPPLQPGDILVWVTSLLGIQSFGRHLHFFPNLLCPRERGVVGSDSHHQ